jgi:hypothetical protein
MPAFFASQRRTTNPIKGTKDWPLFQTFRYGRDQLSFSLPVQDGNYLIELYFAEPWWGVGGGIDCSGFRLFDVAVNDNVVLKNLDIWKEAGSSTALKKNSKGSCCRRPAYIIISECAGRTGDHFSHCDCYPGQKN